MTGIQVTGGHGLPVLRARLPYPASAGALCGTAGGIPESQPKYRNVCGLLRTTGGVQHESTATGRDGSGSVCTLQDCDLRRWTPVDGLPADGMQEVRSSSLRSLHFMIYPQVRGTLAASIPVQVRSSSTGQGRDPGCVQMVFPQFSGMVLWLVTKLVTVRLDVATRSSPFATRRPPAGRG